MSAKHTPGPWKLGNLSREIMDRRGYAVASPPEDQGESEQWAADARLVAAAPELLEALRPFAAQGVEDDAPCHRGLVPRNLCSRCGPILAARAAISTATGGES